MHIVVVIVAVLLLIIVISNERSAETLHVLMRGLMRTAAIAAIIAIGLMLLLFAVG